MYAITMGDPNGIGPEIIQKYLVQTKPTDILVVGNRKALQQYGPIEVEVIDPFGDDIEFGQGRSLANNGLASYRYVLKAIEMALQGQIKALITAPINKDALHKAGIKMDGHTEILAEACGTKKFGMMFWSDHFCLMLTTIHKSLKEVPSLVTAEKFAATIDLAIEGMGYLGNKDPKIAVCGLNPHAGEGGIFGREEGTILEPIIAQYQAKGVKISGPYPSDTLFTPQRRGQFDLIIAHYHDQGLIPLKMLAFDSAVNITVGLPIVRTSVDHGTAYDIVGKGVAHLTSLANSVEVARRIVANRYGA